MTFVKGERVKTPHGYGNVVYQRMSRESGYSKACAVSVFLDDKRNCIGYYGTIFSAEKVEKVDEQMDS